LSRNEDSIQIVMREATLGDVPVTLLCDLLVIPEAVRPSIDNPRLKEILKTDLDEEGFLQPGNIRHRLISNPRRGIFFLGTCHDEIDNGDLFNEICEIKGFLDQFRVKSLPVTGEVAQINENRCVRCLTCIRACPHGAVVLQDSFQPRIIPDACFGCGQCVSACPARAIEQSEISEEPVEGISLLKETVVFACERSAALAEKEARRLGLDSMEKVRLIPVPCAGSVGIETMLEPLLGNTERVIIIGCHQGNCRSGFGGTLASGHVRRVAQDTGISDSQLNYYSVAANEPIKLSRIISK